MERNERVDFYKAMLMLGVVWGHCITNLLAGDNNNIGIHTIVRTYDMPMFMLISGYYLAFSMRKKWRTIVKDKFVRIVVPTLFWGLLICRGNIFNALDCLYFLCAIFLSAIIVASIGKLINCHYIQAVSFIFVTILSNFIPLYLYNLSYLFPYFALGYLVNLYQVHKPNPSLYVCGMISWITCLCFWDKSYTIWATGSYFKDDITFISVVIVVFRYFIALVGILSFMKISDILYDYFKNRRTFIFDIFINSGKETLMIYILHTFLLLVINRIMLMINAHLGYNPLSQNELFLGYIVAPVLAFSCIFLITWMLQYVKKYQYCRIICGYKY